MDKLKFQILDFAGVKTLVRWAQLEGWNPGAYDAEVFWATDPEGFYGYYKNDELIAGGSIVSYNGEFGFMGFFIVKPEYRGKGIGRKLWHQRRDTLLTRLKPRATIGMDGVVAMQSFYEKGGFKIAYRDERYERIGERFEIDPNISNIEDEDLEAILAYDKAIFGFARPQFMLPWLKLPNSKLFKYTHQGNLKGFVVVRKANTGFKVCPLFADNPIIADALYKACLNAVKDEALYIDIPVINQGAVDLIKKYQARYVFECARMYHGTKPNTDINKVFGITTFELG